MALRHLAVAAAAALAMTILLGCEDPQPQSTRPTTSFLEDNPWVVRKPGRGTAVASTGETRVDNPVANQTVQRGESYLTHKAGVAARPDDPIEWPIWAARGKWTVRLAFYNPTPDTGYSALHYANIHARELRKKGYEAYITDLISKAIVTVGSFDSPNDPQLIALWRQAYEDWTKIYGGRASPFRESMARFYGNNTVFGDQPMPVAVIELQVAMKNAYGVALNEEDKAKYLEFTKLKAKPGENS